MNDKQTRLFGDVLRWVGGQLHEGLNKAAFVSVCERSADLCSALPGKPQFYTPKVAPNGKKGISIFFQTKEKTNKWAGNMLMFHVDVNMNQSMNQSTLSFERQ